MNGLLKKHTKYTNKIGQANHRYKLVEAKQKMHMSMKIKTKDRSFQI